MVIVAKKLCKTRNSQLCLLLQKQRQLKIFLIPNSPFPPNNVCVAKDAVASENEKKWRFKLLPEEMQGCQTRCSRIILQRFSLEC
jgi:hypothetical protein